MTRALAFLAAGLFAAGSAPASAAAQPNCSVPEATPSRGTVLVYLVKENIGRRLPADVRNFVARVRPVRAAEVRAPLRAALRRLLRGPTRREHRLGCRSTFSNDGGVLGDVAIVGGRAIVSFRRRPFLEELAIVSASHAGAVFMRQLELTIFQFPTVDSIQYEFDGDCRRFGWFMQAGRCMVVHREPVPLAGRR